jgi:hypothetical protein
VNWRALFAKSKKTSDEIAKLKGKLDGTDNNPAEEDPK